MNIPDVAINTHFWGGFIAPLFIYVHPILTVLVALMFLVYEIQEWLQIRDTAYRDIKEWSQGFFASSIILLILVVIKEIGLLSI